MRKSVVAAIAVAACALIAVTSRPAGALRGERAHGRGISAFNEDFSFRARGTGTGIEATGVFEYTSNAGQTVIGEITCMSLGTAGPTVVGVLGGTITDASNPAQIGLQFAFVASDSSESGDGFGFIGSFSSATPCATTGSTSPIQSGRITLTDR